VPNLRVIIPSRGRLTSLRRCVNSAIALAAESVSVIVFFDEDEECYEAYDPPPNCRRVETTRAYYVKLMNTAFDFIVDEGADHFVICNNDQEFIEPGWDIVAMRKLYEKWDDGMGVLEIGNHESMSYNTFISRTSFWQEHFNGKLFDPRFIQYYADTDRVKTLNENDQLARISPGLVNTHLCWDEVKYGGRQFMTRDKEEYDKKHLV